MGLRVGLIGCGNISDIYLINASQFRDIRSPPAPTSILSPQRVKPSVMAWPAAG